MEIRRRNLLTDDELAKIKAPTLVVWTHDDPTATLSDGRKYADAIADSRFVVFENSAHMPQLEEPERFNALHLAFMADPKSIEPTVDPLARSDAAADKLTEKTQ
jgi:2-hydroxy-6-oxonona-2,4-dienedioate hydrolase